MSAELTWLPLDPEWDRRLRALKDLDHGPTVWRSLQRLALSRIEFVQTGRLNRESQRLYRARAFDADSLRVAVLGSSTLKHLIPGIRVAGLRRGLWLEIYEGSYGQYRQELLEPSKTLQEFAPEFICLALDAHTVLDLMSGGLASALAQLQTCWRQAREGLGATVIQQTALPVFDDLFGSNEHRLGESPQAQIAEFNIALRAAADEAGVALLAVDKYVALGGVDTWHDAALWHLAKQEVHPGVSPLYGELLVRMIAAQRGLSAKCLVLDLDNTLWGGTIGDDGMDGIVLGKGNAVGEAHLAVQSYALQMKRRGVILAVCSKNDEVTAREPFEQHEGMLLRLEDIACFVANWEDKATNLRRIADRLKIGLNAMVFVDDNPAERDLVRRELPEVHVPELPDDPAGYVACIARAGYFEGIAVTEEDRQRAEQYRANGERETSRQGATDLEGYLRGLEMRGCWRPFDAGGLVRIVQLTNKTNQFNLTTERTSEQAMLAVLADPCALSWQVRLKDRFGDHGVVALMHGRLLAGGVFALSNWLMSCRVLGRQVEEACMNTMVECAARRGARQMTAMYRPSAKNGMVRDLLQRLGFEAAGEDEDEDEDKDGAVRWQLDLANFEQLPTAVKMEQG